MSTTSCWLEGCAPLAPRLQGSVEADVAIIGAGLCGAGAALALSRAGVRVAWIEGGRVCGGASGRNAGFLLQGTAERYNRAVAIHGRERARQIHAVSLRNHARMRQAVADLALDCAYMNRGSLQLAGSEEEERDLLQSAAALREDGFSAELRQGEALDPVFRGAGFRLGVFLPADGELQPASFVRGVAAAAVSAGAALYEDTPVLELDAPATGDVRVVTAEGLVRAELALLCTNARAGELAPWLSDKIDAVRGQMLATAAAPPLFPCPIYADHGFDYWRQDETGRVALGGWRNLDSGAERGNEDVLHEGIQARMTEFLQRFDGLRGIPVTHRWSGTMGFSRDGLPIVGALPGKPGALVAAGFTGHGFGFAFEAGHALAELVTEGRSEFAETFTSRRFS